MKLSPRIFNPADWLKTKPYKRLTTYDNFYVQRCRELYELLLDYEDWFAEVDMDRDELVELAGMLGCYFEDFTSEIGIWSAFVRYNQSLYGYPLPFYDLTDYDTDYINEADLAFLIWKYITNFYPTRTWAPDHPYIMEMAQDAFLILEETIDDAPATAFYEDYLTVKATDDFFLLKEKLGWFSISSYLLGAELAPKLQDTIDENIMTYPPEHISKMIYMLSEPYTFSVRSSFSALNTAEWFAEVARCSPEVKDAIRQTQQGHTGNYQLVDDTNKIYYVFRHEQTDRLYRVRRDSLFGGKPLPGSATKSDLMAMNLRKWHNDWWLSGILISVPINEDQRKAYQDKLVRDAWLYDDDKLASVREAEVGQERAFLACFGSPLAIFQNEKEYMAAADRLMEVSNQMNMKHDVVLPPGHEAKMQRRSEQFKEGNRLPPEFRKAKDVSMFYRSGVGSMIFTNVKADAIDILTASAPTEKQRKELFEFMAISMNPDLGRYLLDTYGTHNFRYPIEASRVNAVRDIEFLWRFYSPDEFGPIYPMVSLI